MVRDLIKRRQISFRSILLFAVVFTCCIVIISSISFIHTTKAMSGMYARMCQFSIEQVANSFNIILQNIVDISRTFYENEIGDGSSQTKNEIYDLLKRNIFLDFSSRFLLQNKIDRVLYSNRYIHSVYLYSDVQKFIGTTDNGFYHIDDFKDLYFIDWYNRDSRNIALLETHPVPDQTKEDGTYHLFSICVRLPFGASIEDSHAALVINLDQYKIYNEIINKMNFSDEIDICIADTEGKIILSEFNSLLYEQVDSVPSFSRKDSTWKVSLLDTDSKLVVNKEDPERGWHYFAAYPFSEAAALNIAIGRLIIISAFLTCVFCVLILGLLIFKQLKPVDEITNLFREKSGAGSANSNLLIRLRDSVYRTYRNNDELRSRLEVSWPLFREQFLHNLVTGKLRDKDEMRQKMDLFSLHIPESPLFLIMLHFDNYQQVLTERQLDDSIMSFSIREIAQHAIRKEGCIGFVVATAPEHMAVVIDRQGKTTSGLLVFMKSLQRKILDETDISVTMAVSDEETSLGNLSRTFKKVMETLKYNMLFGHGEIIHYNDIKKDGNGRFHFPEKENQELKSYLRIGDKKRAEETVRKLLKQPEDYESYFYAQFFLLRLSLSFVEIINELHMDIEQILGKDGTMESMLKIRTTAESERFFCGIIRGITENIEAENEEKKSRYYKRIRTYIDENFMNNITLETASEEIGLSPTYINKILKQSEHHTFIEALNAERVRCAKEYLLETDAQIKEVAYRAGFSSSNYFIKIFKELTGLTPGKYQRNARQESASPAL